MTWHDVAGKCKGMLTQERLNILYKAFHDTKLAGLHDTTMPPPKICHSSPHDLAHT